jgi:hypothetical protein
MKRTTNTEWRQCAGGRLIRVTRGFRQGPLHGAIYRASSENRKWDERSSKPAWSKNLVGKSLAKIRMRTGNWKS